MVAPSSLTFRLPPRGAVFLRFVHLDATGSGEVRAIANVQGLGGRRVLYLPTSCGEVLNQHGLTRKTTTRGGVYWLTPSTAPRWWRVERNGPGTVRLTPAPRREPFPSS